MGADLVVLAEPLVEIGLRLGEAVVELFAEGDPIELVQHRLMEALADPVRPRALGFRPAVIDVFDRQIELVLMPLGVDAFGRPLRAAAVFAAAVGQHPRERNAMLLLRMAALGH